MYSVNPHFGTAKDLLALSNALHARDMYLMVDVAVNHMGSPKEVNFTRYTPFNKAAYYHPQRYITHFNDTALVEQGWLGDSDVPLPDLDTENPTVELTLHAWIAALVQNFRIDGLRLDAVKHVRKDFWPGFIRASGVWCMGEYLCGDPDTLSSWQPYTGGLIDYAAFYHIRRAFKPEVRGMHELSALLTPENRAKWADVQQMVTFMENHDCPRFTHDTNSDPNVVMNALAWTILTDGIPLIYYGQEQSFSGGDDPGCREAMWASEFKITRLYKFISQLNQVRKLCWAAGFGTNLSAPLYTDVNIIVVQKGPVLLVLSNQGANSHPRPVSFKPIFRNGTVLVNVLTSKVLVVKRTVQILVNAGRPHVYVPLKLAIQICGDIPIPAPGFWVKVWGQGWRKEGPNYVWKTGVATHDRDILAPGKQVRNVCARVLGPTREQMEGPYSIFGVDESKE